MDFSRGEHLVGIKAGVDNWNEIAQIQFLTLKADSISD
jgi:hypothetical protein